MFIPKKSEVAELRLKVQELCLTNKDGSVLVDNGSDHIVIIGEPVQEVRLAMQKDDSANALVHFAQSSISIVDSTAYTAGGDECAIKITGLAAMDAGDCLIVRYIVK